MCLQYLNCYGMDHHSRSIYDLYPLCVEHGMPNFIPYLDSRLLETKESKRIKKGMLNTDDTVASCSASLRLERHETDILFK